VNFLIVGKFNILIKLLDRHKYMHIKVLSKRSFWHYIDDLHSNFLITYPIYSFSLAVVTWFWEKRYFWQKMVIFYHSNWWDRTIEKCDFLVPWIKVRTWGIIWSKGKILILCFFSKTNIEVFVLLTIQNNWLPWVQNFINICNVNIRYYFFIHNFVRLFSLKLLFNLWPSLLYMLELLRAKDYFCRGRRAIWSFFTKRVKTTLNRNKKFVNSSFSEICKGKRSNRSLDQQGFWNHFQLQVYTFYFTKRNK